MAGAINMGTNNITNGGTATFTTFSGDLNGTINTATTAVTQSQGNNSTKVATTAYVDAAIGNSTLAEVLANGNTTGGTNIAFTSTDKAIFNSALQIYNTGSQSVIYANTHNLLIDSTTYLTLEATSHIYLKPNGGNNGITITGGGAVTLYHNNASKFATTSSGVSVTGDADVSGEVQVGGQGSNFSENNLRFKSAGAAYIDHNTVGQSFIFRVSGSSSLDTTALTIKSNGEIQANDYGSGNNTGTEAYNLAVDSSGNIIETPSSGGGSGGGTGKGGHYSKVYTTGNAGVAGIAFTIDRGTTGVMVFDVMLTSDTSNACAIAKKYTVVKSYGASPLYNKILDTGPDFDNSDFTVVFAQHTTDTSIKCTITPVQTNTQKIGISIWLGYGDNNATVVMNAS